MLVVCAGLYAYHNSLHGAFVFDDQVAILTNPSIRQFWPLWNVLLPPAGTAVARRPIVNVSFAINYALGGLNVWGYHVVNVGIHILAALALYGIVRRTLRRPGLRERYGEGTAWLALAVALVWVVHPLQTESVDYTTQRTELLMGLFFLLTLYCVIRGAESSSRAAAWYVLAALSSALGVGSKEVTAMAPIVVLAYDRLFLSASLRETFQRRWGLYAGLAASWLIVGTLLLTYSDIIVTQLSTTTVSPWEYARTQTGVIVHYLRLAFWPDPLVGDYDDWPVARSIIDVLPAALVVTTLLAATVWALLRRLRVALLGVWVFLILAPTSSFYPIATEVVAERRMYLPLAALIVLVVLGGHEGLGKIWPRLGWPTARLRLVEAAVLVVMVAALASLTVRRNEDYRSELAFWSDVVAKRPNSARGHVNIGPSLHKLGKSDEAMAHYSRALRIKPDYAQAHNNLGILLADRGNLEEAIAHYSQAIRTRPDLAETYNNLGVALAKQGRLEEAIAQYSRAIRIRADYAEAYANLGNARVEQGRLEEAIASYSRAIRIKSDSPEMYSNLGTALARQGRLKEAGMYYAKALQIVPSAAVHYNWAIALAREGNTPEAIRHLQDALKLDPALQPARRALGDLTSSGKK